MNRLLYSLLFLTFLFTDACVFAEDVQTVEITLRTGKESSIVTIYCQKFSINPLVYVPGEMIKTKRGSRFKTFSEKIDRLKAKRKRGSKLSLARKILKLGRVACSRVTPPFSNPTPTPPTQGEDPPVPSGLPLPPAPSELVDELEAYTGPFGAKEARTLCNRVRFGCTPQEIDEYVSVGLEETVNRIMAYREEPQVATVQADLVCDGYLPGQNGNKSLEECAPRPTAQYNNNISISGVILNYLYAVNNSSMPYYYRFMFFLHNRFMAVSAIKTDYYGIWSVPKHVEMVKEAAVSGDFREFMHAWPQDYLGHLKWLSGDSNRGSQPNEDFSREFWQLGTMGPLDLEGRPNYTDLDVAQAALAFSGWTVPCQFVVPQDFSTYYCKPEFMPSKHAYGSKRIFQGTPYEAEVGNWEGVWHATLRHPRTLEYIAKKIWLEYLGPNYTATNIRELADTIRRYEYKLHPVMREVMLSKHMFEAENQNQIIRQPFDLLAGFYRTLGIKDTIVSPFPELNSPSYTHDSMFWQLFSIGSVPFRPQTVFGFIEKNLSSEANIRSQRGDVAVILSFMQQRTHYSTPLSADEQNFYNYFINGLEGNQNSSYIVIDRAANMLNLNLTEEQRALLNHYLNNTYYICNGYQDSPADCQEVAQTFNPFPPNNSSPYVLQVWKYKILGLINILASLPQYRLS